jgi:hypothetical protein
VSRSNKRVNRIALAAGYARRKPSEIARSDSSSHGAYQDPALFSRNYPDPDAADRYAG